MKLDRLKRLFEFLQLEKFEVPMPLSASLHEGLYKRMAKPAALRECDVVSITFELAKPTVISIYTAYESQHNGSEYDRHEEEVPVFEEFIDFACDVLANRAYGRISEQMKELERAEFDRRVRLRLRDLRLDE